MKDKDMSLELKENNINDNPFDVMLYHSLELTRDLLFACHRLKNQDIPEQIQPNVDNLYSHIDKITEEFSKLMNMSTETVTICRETSYYYKQDEFNTMNNSLLKFENNMETVWSRCVPNRNDRYEQLRLGKDSNEYKRLLELRTIITESKELSSVDNNYLNSMIDVINCPDTCTKNCWMAQNELEERRNIIKKYNLTENDIEYMLSYRNSNKGESI